MGFRVAPRLLGLRWPEGHPLHGLEVTARAFDLDAFIVQAVELAFADNLAGWNLEDERGLPVPPTRAGVAGLQPGLRMSLALAWREALAGEVAAPEPSVEDAPEASLPMEPIPPQEAAGG